MKQLSMLALAFAALLIGAPLRAQQDTSGPNLAEDPTDTLERAKQKRKLIACADPYDWPYSSQEDDPPGFDIDIMRAIAKRANMRLEIYWANTATRGGTMRAFRNSILAKRCDVFLGLSDNGEDDLLPGSMKFTDAYLGMGYVLIVQGKATGVKSLDDVKAGGFKVGVPMSTPIDDYMFTNQIPRGLYLNNRRILEGMSKGEVDVSMVWSSAVALGKQEFPGATFKMVEGYVPLAGQRFNSKFAVRKQDESLRQFINEGIRELRTSGKLEEIVESYGVPYYDPFAS
jgi:ABC-type amino acid transport substrate-binding protein